MGEFCALLFAEVSFANSGPLIKTARQFGNRAINLSIVLHLSEFLICCGGVAMHPSSFVRNFPNREKATHSGSAGDNELVQLMRGGDEAAFAAFYDRFAPDLFSMIYAILQDEKESEAVLREAFVQMWKHTANYDPARSSLFTWAVMISRHKAIDRLRSRRGQSQLSEPVRSKSEIISGPADRAGNALASSDEGERVRAVLAQLGAGERGAIDLAFFAGLTQTEISERLGDPLGRVKARIRYGLLALREQLREISL